jgi:hypothetical protein
MLTSDDIKKITQAQIEAQKEVFFTKDEMDAKFYSKTEMDVKFSSIQTSVDAIAKDKQTKDQEMPVLNSRIKKTEDWIDKAAIKIGLEFRH